MNKEQKLSAINSMAWELLKCSPRELKAQGINPINLVGATFSTKELLDEMGIDISEEVKGRKL